MLQLQPVRNLHFLTSLALLIISDQGDKGRVVRGGVRQVPQWRR